MYSQAQKNPGCPFDVSYNRNVLKIMKIYSNCKGMHYFMENCPLSLYMNTNRHIFRYLLYTPEGTSFISMCFYVNFPIL